MTLSFMIISKNMTVLITLIVFLKSTTMKQILPYECDYSSEVKLLSRKLMKGKALDERSNQRSSQSHSRTNNTPNKSTKLQIHMIDYQVILVFNYI